MILSNTAGEISRKYHTNEITWLTSIFSIGGISEIWNRWFEENAIIILRNKTINIYIPIKGYFPKLTNSYLSQETVHCWEEDNWNKQELLFWKGEVDHGAPYGTKQFLAADFSKATWYGFIEWKRKGWGADVATEIWRRNNKSTDSQQSLPIGV